MMATGLDICVCNPHTGNYTTYEILIKTDNPAFTLHLSSTRRRYNDFCWLKKILKKHHPMVVCPELPEKKYSDRFDIQFLVQRMAELKDWLYSVVSTSLYLSDTALHMFLQTSLSCKQIEQYLKGNLEESDVQRAYKDAEVSSDDQYEKEIQASCNYDKPPDPDGKETLPIQIRSPASWTDTQDRSDSGIADYDTDNDSSYSSSESSSCVQSVESGLISEKYPALTEVTLPSPCRSYSGKSAEENIVQTAININPNVKLYQSASLPSRPNTSLGLDNTFTDEGNSSMISTLESETPEQKPKPTVTHKVEMGVIFSLNS